MIDVSVQYWKQNYAHQEDYLGKICIYNSLWDWQREKESSILPPWVEIQNPMKKKKTIQVWFKLNNWNDYSGNYIYNNKWEWFDFCFFFYLFQSSTIVLPVFVNSASHIEEEGQLQVLNEWEWVVEKREKWKRNHWNGTVFNKFSSLTKKEKKRKRKQALETTLPFDIFFQ